MEYVNFYGVHFLRLEYLYELIEHPPCIEWARGRFWVELNREEWE